MRTLITGASGVLGSALLAELDDGVSERPVALDADALDISDGAAVAGFFARHAPFELVVNCAAMTDVDACERLRGELWRTNALGPLYLAQACSKSGAKLVQISTDYVFEGLSPGLKAEDHPAGPVNAYGKAKRAAELLVRAACPRSHVVRTSRLFSPDAGGFAQSILRTAARTGKISVVDDQVGNPTYAKDLARAILQIARSEDYGVWHAANAGACSWFAFARAILETAGIACEKEPLTSEQYKRRFPASADRPRFSGLSTDKLAGAGCAMRPWREALADFVEELEKRGELP